MTAERALHEPQRVVIGGFKRECAVQCEKCGFKQVFVVYADVEHSDEWCDEELDSMLQQEDWTSVGGNDFCPECSEPADG